MRYVTLEPHTCATPTRTACSLYRIQPIITCTGVSLTISLNWMSTTAIYFDFFVADGNSVVGSYCGTETCSVPLFACGCGACIQGPYRDGQHIKEDDPAVAKLDWHPTDYETGWGKRRLQGTEANGTLTQYVVDCVTAVRRRFNVTYFESPDTINAYFDCFDKDASGFLDVRDNITLTEIPTVDTNGDRVIEQNEFDSKLQGEAVEVANHGQSLYGHTLALGMAFITLCIHYCMYT